MSVETNINISPITPSEQVKKTCSGIFMSEVKQTQTKFTYISPNDYGREIRKLLFAPSYKGFSENSHRDLSAIAKIEKFSILETSSPCFIRDSKLLRTDGAVLMANSSNSLNKALFRCAFRHKHLKNHHVSTLTDSRAFPKASMGHVFQDKLQSLAHEQIKETPVVQSRLYYEGGNIFRFTNTEGRQKALIGEDIITVTHLALLKDEWFEDNFASIANKSRKNEKAIDDEISKQFFSGAVYTQTKQIAEDFAKTADDKTILSILDEMSEMNLLDEMDFITEAEQTKGRDIAANYYAQRLYIKNHLLPSELQVKAEDIVEIPQIGYHIDLYMTPGPRGSIFVQDYDEAIRLLEHLLENSESLKLSQTDVKILKAMILETSKLKSDFKEIMSDNKKTLEDAKFHIINTPGAFFSLAGESKTQNVNFLNCISGYSTGTHRFYMAIPGTSVGDHLGRVLMESYVAFLNQHCENLDVFFIGSDPKNPNDFSETMSNLNEPEKNFGPHCQSFEHETSPVTI